VSDGELIAALQRLAGHFVEKRQWDRGATVSLMTGDLAAVLCRAGEQGKRMRRSRERITELRATYAYGSCAALPRSSLSLSLELPITFPTGEQGMSYVRC
jgi:hypothetical protein